MRRCGCLSKDPALLEQQINTCRHVGETMAESSHQMLGRFGMCSAQGMLSQAYGAAYTVQEIAREYGAEAGEIARRQLIADIESILDGRPTYDVAG